MIKLPYPPSINHYYGLLRSGGKYIKKAGLDFRLAVKLAINGNSFGAKPLSMIVDLYQKDRRLRDYDNPLKALNDALTKAELWLDDSQVNECLVRKRGLDAEKKGYCEVEILEDGELTKALEFYRKHKKNPILKD